ncbi:MAG: hypothetical protein IJG23_01595 [Clostridia bacterium]|nr:hypothetical protein [Clostridia bacterium]
MTEITVKVGSVTNAQKGRRILQRNGIHAVVKRSVHIRKGDGCGYTIVFNGERQTGIQLLQKAGIKIISVRDNDISG